MQQKRSLVIPVAALAAVITVAVGGLTLAGPSGVWVIHDTDDYGEEASAGWLGVRVDEAVDHDAGGAVVRSVVADSPAQRAGLRSGDVIVAVDGDAVRGPASLTQRIRDREGGDRITLTVVRGGREMDLDAELEDIGTMIDDRLRVRLEGLQIDLEDLGERLEGIGEIHLEGLAGLAALENLEGLKGLEGLEHLENMDFDFDFDFDHLSEIGENIAHMGHVFIERCHEGDCEGFTIPGDRPLLGVGLSDTTPELRRHLGGDDEAGALVDRVVDGSPAATAGVRVGDLITAIDGTPVKSAWEIRRAIADRVGDRLQVDVVRDGTPLRIDVELPERRERDERDDRDDRDDDDRRPRGPRA